MPDKTKILEHLKTLKEIGQKAVNKAVKTAANKTKVERHLVGLDVGTEYVKALIGRVKDNEIEILGVGRAHQNLTDMQAGAIADISAVVQNCNTALSEAEGQAGVSARTAVIGIAGELVKGTTTTVKFSRKSSKTALDLTEIERIIHLAQKRAEERARQALAWELGGKDVEIRLVNSALVGIEIDGYKVTNPVGFQGRELVLELYTAFAPMIHIGALERVAKELDLELMAVAAEPFAVSRSVIGDDPNVTISAILMDVGGGTTDIAMVTDGGVQGTKMFGIGGRAFTKALAKDKNIKFDQAEALKIGLSTHKTPETIRPKIEEAMEPTLNVWLDGVELALSEFKNVDHMPSQILLCGGGSSLDSLVAKLRSSDWYGDLPFTKHPVVKHIRPHQVVGIVDKTGTLTDHTYITAMGLLRVGLDTMHQRGEDSANLTLKQRINRLLST